jgi:NADH dehydrogenase [ubiquinone] 1 alpha subcomplex assembly factor 1
MEGEAEACAPTAMDTMARGRAVVRTVAHTPRRPQVSAAASAAFAGAAADRDNGGMSIELFRFASTASTADWSAIDDGVMGGASHSRLRHDPAGYAVFEGVVSLANGGGFASVRSRPSDLCFAGAGNCVLDVRGDGRRYKLSLRTDDAFDGVGYQAEFTPPAGAWAQVRLPVAAFLPTFRGRGVRGAPPLDAGRVRQAGLMVADGKAGPFALAIRSLRAE